MENRQANAGAGEGMPPSRDPFNIYRDFFELRGVHTIPLNCGFIHPIPRPLYPIPRPLYRESESDSEFPNLSQLYGESQSPSSSQE
jgi:hypothetical protein